MVLFVLNFRDEKYSGQQIIFVDDINCGDRFENFDVMNLPGSYSSFLLFPFGAGLILGVYVTVRVTISRT